MPTHPEQVVVTPAGHSILGLHMTAVHHRDLPEAEGEGSSPEDAANHLAGLLARALDGALSEWRRQNLLRAIADVEAFTSHAQAWAERPSIVIGGGRTAPLSLPPR